MATAGCLDERMTAPRQPRWPPRGISEERAEKLQPLILDPKKYRRRIRPEEVPIIERFRKRWHAATGRRSKLSGKVPAFKFTSNDGWWVRPEECRVVSTVLMETLRDRPKKLHEGLRARGYKRALRDIEPLVAPWALQRIVIPPLIWDDSSSALSILAPKKRIALQSPTPPATLAAPLQRSWIIRASLCLNST